MTAPATTSPKASTAKGKAATKATNNVASLDDYRRRIGNLPASQFVGSILWFSIMGATTYVDNKRVQAPVRVTPEQLTQWFEELDLDKKFLPPAIKKVDAFRKATSEVKSEYTVTHESEWVATCPKCKQDYTFGSKKPTNSFVCETDNTDLVPSEKRSAVEGVTAELMVREVTYDNDLVVRHLVKEIRDRRGQKLSYEPHIATIKFHRGARASRATSGGKMDVKIMPSVTGVDLDNAKVAIEQMKKRYDDLAGYLHADAIRAVLRNYVVSLNAISVKPSGGIYFVHTSRQRTVDNLQKLVERIGQGCMFHQLPLLDTEEQRNMLTEAFQTEVEDDVRLLIKDIATYNEAVKKKGDAVDTKKYAEFSSRYQDILEASEEYTRILGLAQGRSASALDLAMDAVTDLADRL